jgi:hypothetical protein
MPFANARLINSEIVSSIPFHFNSLAQLYRAEITLNNYNEPITTYVQYNIAPIRCYIEPKTDSEEIRRPDQTIVTEPFTVSLQGYFPNINLTDILVINFLTYNILGIVHDDHKTLTYLTVEINREGS